MAEGKEAVGLGMVWCDGVVGCGDHDTHGWGVCFGMGDAMAHVSEFQGKAVPGLGFDPLDDMGRAGLCAGLCGQLSLPVVYGFVGNP